MYNHGIYIKENPTKMARPTTVESAIQFVVGTAPVNMTDGKVNELVIINSYEEAVQKLGYSNDLQKFTLMQSINASFEIFNVAPLVVVNVLDPQIHKTAVAEAVHTVLNKVVAIEEEGILLDENFVVKDETNTTTYEKDTDYTASFNLDGTLKIRLSDALTDTSVSISYEQLDPSLVTDDEVIGQYDTETETYTGIQLAELAFYTLGINVSTLLAPGYSHKKTVGQALTRKAKKISALFSAEALIDIDTIAAPKYSDVAAEKLAMDIRDTYGIMLWPMLSRGGKRYAYSALYGALLADTDDKNDGVPYVSASNKALKIDATVLTDGTEVFLTIEKANELNGNGIVTAINLLGWKSWGNNTSAYPETIDPKDRFIPSRRMFNWWGNRFIRIYFNKVDSPMNLRLIEAIVDNENIVANGYKSRYQIAEARIEFIQDDNPEWELLDGNIRFNQILTTFPPTKQIINTLEFNANALTTALFGGE